MSTRSTIHYGSGLHIYLEQNADEVCLEVEPFWFSEEGPKLGKRNEKYGGLVIGKQDLINLAHDLNKFLRIDPNAEV